MTEDKKVERLRLAAQAMNKSFVSTVEFKKALKELILSVSALLKNIRGEARDQLDSLARELKAANSHDVKELEMKFHGEIESMKKMAMDHGDMEALKKTVSEMKLMHGDMGPMGPQGPAGSPDKPEEVRDKLETLEGDERLDKKAIKGLETVVEQSNLDRAVSILDSRTSFLINKINDVKNSIPPAGNGTGDMLASTYDPAGIDEQIVGLTATQTLTNKRLTSPKINEDVAITATATELNYTDGVTSAIQTQLDAKATATSTTTFTNKRITKRTGTATSSATPTINTDSVDFYSLTAQAVDITSFTTNLSGTPTEAQTLWIAITGTAARAITWGASFEASTVALPTTTVTTNRLDVGFVWNTVTSKWRCVATS